MRVPVAIPGQAYEVHVEDDTLQGLGRALAEVEQPKPVVLISNPVVGELYLEAARASLDGAGFPVSTILVPDGEEHKNLATWQILVEQLLALGVQRSTPILALGGGVTGDIVGFAAATVVRGVPFVQVPTTLLAMVDSAVGGKTGVNSARGKNLVGAFHQPRLVYAATGTLRTLLPAELGSGLGELLKHGVIRDAGLFELCEGRAEQLRGDTSLLASLVARSCAIKAEIVAQDERETGLRAILNFGHTVGHAVETALGHGTLRHGECVALGMIAEARWAASRGACRVAVADRVEALCGALQLPVRAPATLDMARARSAIRFDKKLARATLTTAILEGIGKVRLDRIGAAELDSMLDNLPTTET